MTQGSARRPTRAIQEAMGHKSLETTMGYLHTEVLNPLDLLRIPPDAIPLRVTLNHSALNSPGLLVEPRPVTSTGIQFFWTSTVARARMISLKRKWRVPPRAFEQRNDLNSPNQSVVR
jgi:hypothetical protein